ncbi:MAG: response regulator [Sandaracinus sp.]|nr:response regulator [Sandaracinus sp.]
MVSAPATVLIVEDDPDLRRLIVRLLEHDGFSVRAAADGREALDALEPMPDVIVADLMMPDLDGEQFSWSFAAASPRRGRRSSWSAPARFASRWRTGSKWTRACRSPSTPRSFATWCESSRPAKGDPRSISRSSGAIP